MVSNTSSSEKVKRITERPTPINLESPFNFDELFFSITDTTSAIQFANEVFLRVAKYSSDEMMGQFHNVIRHPDMPKSAFRIMWEHLKRKEAVAVYVKNLAKDGSYYWVTALIFPIKGGYFSIRLKPGSRVFQKVKTIYDKVLVKEKELLTELNREQAINYSKEYLIELIQEEGFKDYDHFMRFALLQEMHHRYDKIKAVSKPALRNNEVNKLDQRLISVDQILTDLVEFSHSLNKLHAELFNQSRYLLELSDNVEAVAQNARLQSTKLDGSDRSLFVISEKMGEQTKMGEANLNELLTSVSKLERLFSELSFDIISAKLQVEMATYYNREVQAGNAVAGQIINEDEAMILLNESYRPRLQRLVQSVSKIRAQKRTVLNGILEIERYLTVLRFILVTGKVEIPRLHSNKSMFEDIFGNLAKQIESADKHLSSLKTIIIDNEHLFDDYEQHNARLVQVCVSLK